MISAKLYNITVKARNSWNRDFRVVGRFQVAACDKEQATWMGNQWAFDKNYSGSISVRVEKVETGKTLYFPNV